MNKQSLKISALDTLFFKDGKPFSMGEESWAKGIFPPYPSVMVGMMRSIWFADHLDKLRYANRQGEDESLNLRLIGYLPLLEDEPEKYPKTSKPEAGTPAFPIPADLYALKAGTDEGEDHAANANCLQCWKRTDHMISEYELKYILGVRSSEKVEDASGKAKNSSGKVEDLSGKAVLRLDVFADYLAGKTEGIAYARLKDYTTDEPKIGIAKDRHTRTSAHGQLYRLAMKRLQGKKGKLSFLLSFEGLSLPKKGLTRLGAEAKAAAYTEHDFPHLARQSTHAPTHFKIYLATPAVFAEGSYPRSWFEHHGITLLAAAIGKPEHIGGFDIQKGRPKPMSKAVPAGSVYYVQVSDPQKAEALQKSLHQGSIYSLAPSQDVEAADNRRQGFGLSFIGIFQPQTL